MVKNTAYCAIKDNGEIGNNVCPSKKPVTLEQHQVWPSIPQILRNAMGVRKNYKRVVHRCKKGSQVQAGGQKTLTSSENDARELCTSSGSKMAPAGPVPPFNPTSFSTSYVSTSAVDVSKKPRIVLKEWWLAKVEGHRRKISVSGFYERNKAVQEFTAGLIVTRHNTCTLENEDGIIVLIDGIFNSERTLQNGFTIQACEQFLRGFPFWWEDWEMLYPYLMSSQTGSQLRSPRASSSREDSAKCSATSMRRQALHEKTVPGEATKKIASSDKPVGPSRKQRSASGKLKHTMSSPNINDNQCRLTRDKADSQSVSMPEYLKLKRTKSGRVVVPALVLGCQSIVYDPDGSIVGIDGLDLPLLYGLFQITSF